MGHEGEEQADPVRHLFTHLAIQSLTYCPRMRRTVEECAEMMGETGQGCMSEEDVKQTKIDRLIRTWSECHVEDSSSMVVELICSQWRLKRSVLGISPSSD